MIKSWIIINLLNNKIPYPPPFQTHILLMLKPYNEIYIFLDKSLQTFALTTFQWARDTFEGLFTIPAENVNQYIRFEEHEVLI